MHKNIFNIKCKKFLELNILNTKSPSEQEVILNKNKKLIFEHLIQEKNAQKSQWIR